MKVRSRSKTFEAKQFFIKKKPWPGNIGRWGGDGPAICVIDGEMIGVKGGDWVIMEDKKNIEVCSAKEFKAKYRIVKSSPRRKK